MPTASTIIITIAYGAAKKQEQEAVLKASAVRSPE